MVHAGAVLSRFEAERELANGQEYDQAYQGEHRATQQKHFSYQAGGMRLNWSLVRGDGWSFLFSCWLAQRRRVRPGSGSGDSRPIHRGGDLLLLVHLGASSGARARGETNDLLGRNWRLGERLLRTCIRELGMGFLRRAPRFAIEPESEQNDDQSGAAANYAEEANSREVERTEGYGKANHREYGQGPWKLGPCHQANQATMSGAAYVGNGGRSDYWSSSESKGFNH